MKNEKLLNTLEKETYLYALAHSDRKTEGFINRIFAYLRKNKELLQDANYKKLYNECIILIKWLYRKSSPNLDQEAIEIITDLMNREDDFSYSKEIVDAYLNYRIDAWNSGYYDELYK